MKKSLLVSLLFNVYVANSQNGKKWFKVQYVNMTSFSVAKNTESYFAKFRNDITVNGLSLDINTIHGLRFFHYVAISGGISLDLNINKTFLSTPYMVDVRIFSSKTLDNCWFGYLQTGRNIKWSNNGTGDGGASKLGIGAIFSIDDQLYFIDVFQKSKTTLLDDYKDLGFYSADGLGFSIGIIF